MISRGIKLSCLLAVGLAVTACGEAGSPIGEPPLAPPSVEPPFAGTIFIDSDIITASDATTFQPDSLFDLITSFYIQVPPEGRARMLSNAANSLAPGGTLLFVSHDRSAPPEGWSDEHIASLTTPDEVASEIPVLKIEQAYVSEHADTAHMGNSDERHDAHFHEADDHDADGHSEHESHGVCGSGSTVVRARRL